MRSMFLCFGRTSIYLYPVRIPDHEYSAARFRAHAVRRDAQEFLPAQAERILPAYVLFLLIACWSVQDAWRRDWPYYVSFLQNVPYAFHDSYNALTPLWSLAIEQHFYLFWPALVFFLPRRFLAPAMIALLLLCPLLRAACTPLFSNSTPIYSLTPFRLDAMAAGALAALPAGVSVYAVLAYHHPWFTRAATRPSSTGLPIR